MRIKGYSYSAVIVDVVRSGALYSAVTGGGSRDSVVFSDVRGAVRLVIGDDSGAVVVTMRYAAPGSGAVWSATIEQLEERVPIPWDVSVRHETKWNGEVGYSVVVDVAVPDGVPVTWERVAG